MTRIALILAVLMLASGSAMAQERQVYSPYPQPNFAGDPYGYALSQQAPVQQVPNTYRVYPGREQHGQNFGYLPRHPGDYRDAVDRGMWEGGGGYQMPRRSHTGY